MRTRDWGLALTIGLLHSISHGQDQKTSATYRLPFEEGASVTVTQGNNGSYSHNGRNRYAFDFGCPEGTKVCAARGGKVVTAAEDEQKSGEDGKYGRNGNHIRIDHGDGTQGVYCHLKFEGALVEVGDIVMQGDVIALSGQTGRVTGPHLHFQVNRGGASIPVKFEDVDKDDGIPLKGKSYVSHNTPGIPAPVKDRLTRLARASKVAETEGAFHLAHQAWSVIVREKLKVDYPLQEEAKKKLEELDTKATDLLTASQGALEGSFAETVRTLLLAKLPYGRTPASAKIVSLLSEASKHEDFESVKRETAPLLKQQQSFFSGLKSELEEQWVRARTHYKNVLLTKVDSDFSKRAAERLAAVEEKIKGLPKRS